MGSCRRDGTFAYLYCAFIAHRHYRAISHGFQEIAEIFS